MKLFRFAYRFSKYSSQNHSLLQQIYSYNYRDHYIAYMILDHQSKSIISIDPGDFEAAFYNIKNLEINSGYKLNYILQTHGRSNHTASVLELYSKFKEAKVYSGIVENQLGTLFQTDFAREFQPFQIGDLAICYIQANGHSFDNYMIAITDTNSQSTKIPILFSGDTILVNNVGEIEDYGKFFATLQKLRGFHDETLIFPGHLPQQEVFLFSKTLEPDNIIIQNKMGLDNLIPTTLIEERMGNPYFRYAQLNGKVKEPDPIKYLKKLKNIQNKYFNGQKV
ncbi:unnamed protein product [Paramecium sonneborni]|uniref:Metallo-beta-lactamase domain-containing protein n=1 Tax=Paramecium sonneborni TaxID=65129 RepID=A0A8S1QUY9_9CILI|nr:unnamed protein product [Paramecium sonneborni]